jgi:protocatechuate 3,4-dioxygenase beta subunit
MTARKSVSRSLLALLALCGGLVAWFALRLSDGPVDPVAAADRVNSTAAAAQQLDDPARALGSRGLDPRGSDTQRATAAEQGDLAAASAPPLVYDTDRAVLVRVVRDDTGAPIPKALVRVWPAVQVDWMHYWYEYAAVSDPFERTQKGRYDVEADEHGRVLLARSRAGFTLAARGSGWSGFAACPTLAKIELEVRCRPDRALEIRVLDARDQPVESAWVSLRDRDDAYSSPTWIGRTDAQGQCRFEHAAALLASYDEDAPQAIGLANPGTELIEQRLDPRALPTEPIVLRMPELARLNVQWVDERGRDLDIRGSIDLSYEDGDDERSRAGLSVLQERGYGSYSLEHGRIALACAATGRRVSVSSYALDGWSEASQETPTAQLPERPGATVDLRIALKRVRRTLTGRLLGLDGAPCANAEFRVHWIHAGNAAALLEPAFEECTDAAGRFELHPGGQTSPTVLLRTESASGAWLEARAELAPLAEGEARELGDLALSEAEVLVEGRVVDEFGRAVAHATLHIEMYQSQHQLYRSTNRWNGRRLHTAWTDAEGRFDVPGGGPEFARYDGAPLQVHEIRPHHFAALRDALMIEALPPQAQRELGSAFEPLRPGQRDLVLVLKRAARLAGRLELPPGRRAHEYMLLAAQQQVRGQPATDHRHSTHANDESAPSPGAFDFGPLPAGSYRVSVHDSNCEFELVAIEDVYVGPAAEPDLRLEPLRVPADWHTLRIDLVDASGRPVLEGRVALLDPTRGPQGWSRLASEEFEPGSFHVWLRRLPVDLEAWAEGALPVRALAVDTDTRIVLGDGIPFEVRSASVQAGLKMRVDLDWIEPEDPDAQALDEQANRERAQHRSPWSDVYSGNAGGAAPGPFVLYVPQAGRWRLTAYVERDGDWVALRGPLEEESWDVEIPAGGGSFDLHAAMPAPTQGE